MPGQNQRVRERITPRAITTTYEAADVRVCLTVLVLTVLVLTVLLVRKDVFADDSVAGRLVVAVEHSMPVAGQPCRLWLVGCGLSAKARLKLPSPTMSV